MLLGFCLALPRNSCSLALHNEQQGLAVIFTHVVDCVHGISISAVHIRAKPGETIAKSTCRDLWMEVMLKLVTVAIVQADPFWKRAVNIVYDCPGDGGHF